MVKEELPTLANLIGRIEYAAEMGALVTNFTMIRPAPCTGPMAAIWCWMRARC